MYIICKRIGIDTHVLAKIFSFASLPMLFYFVMRYFSIGLLLFLWQTYFCSRWICLSVDWELHKILVFNVPSVTHRLWAVIQEKWIFFPLRWCLFLYFDWLHDNRVNNIKSMPRSTFIATKITSWICAHLLAHRFKISNLKHSNTNL